MRSGHANVEAFTLVNSKLKITHLNGTEVLHNLENTTCFYDMYEFESISVGSGFAVLYKTAKICSLVSRVTASRQYIKSSTNYS